MWLIVERKKREYSILYIRLFLKAYLFHASRLSSFHRPVLNREQEELEEQLQVIATGYIQMGYSLK